MLLLLQVIWCSDSLYECCTTCLQPSAYTPLKSYETQCIAYVYTVTLTYKLCTAHINWYGEWVANITICNFKRVIFAARYIVL